VRAIAQDAKGFIWIGTAHGLNRYDGYTFWHCFPVKDDTLSLPSPTVNTIVKDAKGVLWLGTANGICRLRPGRWEFDRVFCYPNRIQDQRYAYFESICPDKNGRIWAVNSYNQLFRIHPDQGRADMITLPRVENLPASLPPEARLTPPRITSVAPCGDTAVLIGSTYGLFQFHLEKETFRLIPVDGAWLFGLANIVPAGGDVHHNPDDGLWYVASRQQSAIFVLDSQSRLRHRISPLPLASEPSRIFRDSKGQVWVTTRSQVFLLKTNPEKTI